MNGYEQKVSDSNIIRNSKWEQQLADKRVLPLDPAAFIAIKRDVHVCDIGAPAAAYAEAFHSTMREPGRQFGLIQVLRPTARVGQPYLLGERFQGRYNLPSALHRRVEKGLGRHTAQPLGHLLHASPIERVLHGVGDAAASDFGIIDRLELTPEPDGPERYAFRYRYLEGSPIAGSSTFIVEPLSAKTCRLTQVFEYQEISLGVAAFFSIYGLKLHNQVVYSQALESAKRIDARILSTDIPDTYLDL